jgi:hypothetical protein
LRAFCDAHKIAFIEDCAHALFGLSEGKPIGASGDFAIASLTKFLPVTGGGCLAAARYDIEVETTRRPLHDELKEFANTVEIGARHSAVPLLDASVGVAVNAWRILRGRSASSVRDVEESYQPHDAAYWIADIETLPRLGMRATRFSRWIARHADRARIVALRRRNYDLLCRLLDDVPGARPLFPRLPDDAAPYVFPLLVDDPGLHYKAVRRSGVPVFRWDELWPSTPVIEGDAGLEWSTRVFQIGCHQDLSLEDIDSIATTLRRVVKPGPQTREA